MEPQTNLPKPESIPAPVTPETGGEAVSLEPVEAPPPQEVKRPNEGANQNQGAPLRTPDEPDSQAATQPLPTDDKQPHTVDLDDTPPIADDVDVLEKEWTDKAKAIVDKTREDPYKQNKEMSALKADYMKKRYGKDIKLTED